MFRLFCKQFKSKVKKRQLVIGAYFAILSLFAFQILPIVHFTLLPHALVLKHGVVEQFVYVHKDISNNSKASHSDSEKHKDHSETTSKCLVHMLLQQSNSIIVNVNVRVLQQILIQVKLPSPQRIAYTQTLTYIISPAHSPPDSYQLITT